ncbi:ATP-dependent helicase, partial [mine drainage metagenome]
MLFAGYVPNDRFMLIEQSVDEESERNLIIFHSLYGRRINDAMSRLFGIKIADMHDTEVGVNITDNGFVIMTPEDVRITGKEIHSIIQELGKADLYKILRENIRRTEMMKRRFRHCAARSFMILRNYRGIKIGVRRQHVNSQAILKAVEEMDPNFPILKETYRE